MLFQFKSIWILLWQLYRKHSIHWQRVVGILCLASWMWFSRRRTACAHNLYNMRIILEYKFCTSIGRCRHPKSVQLSCRLKPLEHFLSFRSRFDGLYFRCVYLQEVQSYSTSIELENECAAPFIFRLQWEITGSFNGRIFRWCAFPLGETIEILICAFSFLCQWNSRCFMLVICVFLRWMSLFRCVWSSHTYKRHQRS